MMIDSTTDISGKEILLLIIRYFHIHESLLKEEFIKLFHLKSKNSNYIFYKVRKFL